MKTKKKEDKEVIPFAFNEQEYTFETTSKFALLKEEKTKYYIYYNNYFNNALMITEELDKTVFPELEIVTFIENNNSDNIVQLKEILQKNYFFNIEQIKGYIKSYKLDQQITENKVEEFIKSNFTLNNNIEYKIKFTDIYKQLIKLMNVDNNESKKILKHILPKILKKLKLNKKRYSDGNYWFGIILKEKEKIPEKNIELLLEEKIYERNDI